ncbi:hypothetical protein GGQ26_02215 [Aeromicrobium sp. zg-629]|uniref:hypothetical protein n=1 Tax=Aeromicrobium senzhongii TaxID=2663859 RepID=UPI0012B5D14F|nr:hypothetical protein [Aeromicrobium senzhongii]MTB87171.1 hypothetical protein [Aeromicrobium senzhongii]
MAAGALMDGLRLDRKHTETNPNTGLTGSRSLADVKTGDTVFVKVAETPTRDGKYVAHLVVKFEHPVYTAPVTNPATNTIVNNVEAYGGPEAQVRAPGDCIVNEMDRRVKSIATGETDTGRQWDDSNFACPDLYEQFHKFSTADTPTAIATALHTGTVTGVVRNTDRSNDAADRIRQALTTEEGRIAVRSYKDYRGRIWTGMAVVFDDYPYKAPTRATDIETGLKTELLTRSGASSWPSVDPCMESKAADWAKSIAESKAKNKDYYDDWKAASAPRIEEKPLLRTYGGMDETFASSGCADGHHAGYVIATKSNSVVSIADEIYKSPTFTQEGKYLYARGWGARRTVDDTLTSARPISVASFRDFRGDVWTYMIAVHDFDGEPGVTRLTPRQIQIAEESVVSEINAYRTTSGGLTPLTNSSCIREAVLGSIMFAGTFRVDGSFGFQDIEHRDPGNKTVTEVFKRCNVKSAAEIMTTSSGKYNNGSDQFARELAQRFVQNWKESGSHDPYLRGRDAKRIGLEVRNSDRAGYYVVTASVTD